MTNGQIDSHVLLLLLDHYTTYNGDLPKIDSSSILGKIDRKYESKDNTKSENMEAKKTYDEKNSIINEVNSVREKKLEGQLVHGYDIDSEVGQLALKIMIANYVNLPGKLNKFLTNQFLQFTSCIKIYDELKYDIAAKVLEIENARIIVQNSQESCLESCLE